MHLTDNPKLVFATVSCVSYVILKKSSILHLGGNDLPLMMEWKNLDMNERSFTDDHHMSNVLMVPIFKRDKYVIENRQIQTIRR